MSTQQCVYATVSKNGIPNNAPKHSTRVLDDETLIFTEGVGGTTYQNISDGSKIASAVVDRESLEGYLFIGTPEIQTNRDLYEQTAAMPIKDIRHFANC